MQPTRPPHRTMAAAARKTRSETTQQRHLACPRGLHASHAAEPARVIPAHRSEPATDSESRRTDHGRRAGRSALPRRLARNPTVSGRVRAQAHRPRPDMLQKPPVPGQVAASGACRPEFILHRINPVSLTAAPSPGAMAGAAAAWPDPDTSTPGRLATQDATGEAANSPVAARPRHGAKRFAGGVDLPL